MGTQAITPNKMQPSPVKFFTRCVNRLAGVVTGVRTSEPALALTFDDGPDPQATPELLEILASHGAEATFFMTGQNAAAHPELVISAHQAGHAIGNHTWDHPSLPLVSREERQRQIRKTAKHIPQVGKPLFRPPYGHFDFQSHRDLWLSGHEVIAWSHIVPDWEGSPSSQLLDIAVKAVRPGAIITMHDGLQDSLSDFLPEAVRDRRPTLETVDQLLSQCAGKYQFVTVPELMRRGVPVRECWRMAPDIEFLDRFKRRNILQLKYTR